MLAWDFDIVRIRREMRSGIVWSFLLVQTSSWMVTAQEAVPARSAGSHSEVSEPHREPASGEKASARSNSAVVVDYGPAFERLIKLGLPDAKGAKYVKLTLHGEAGQEAQMMQYQSGMGGRAKTGAKGDAWLLPSAKGDDGLAQLIHAGYGTVKVKKKQKRGGLMRLLVGPEKATKAGGIAGDWTEQDVAADAKKIIEAIESQRGENKMLDPDRWEYSSDGALWCSGVLVQACHMYRAGHTKEANQIVAKLMELAPKPVLVIDYVVNSLATRSYKALAEEFFKTKDWVAYRDGAKEMLQSFTRGWKAKEGVEMLVEQLDRRIKGEKPKIKALKGVTLKPQAIAVLDGLLQREDEIVVDGPMMWVFGSATLKQCARDPNVGYYLQPSKQKWINELIEMGPDAVIALASAATDHSLMASQLGSGNDRYSDYERMRYSMMGSSDGGAATAQYNTLLRPCSRGEIARKLLVKTLPDSGNDLSSSTAEELQSIAYQWWLKHRSASEAQLAKHFLEEGSSNQRRIAVVILIKSGEPSSFKLVEEYILGSEEMDDQLGNATLYLKARRGKARKFYDQFAKALKEEADGQDEDYLSWEIRQAGGVDKYLKKLEVYVNDVSAEKILADMRSGKLQGKEGVEMLKAAETEGDLLKHLPALVSIARKQKEVEQQVELIEQVNNHLSALYREKGSGEAVDQANAYQTSIFAMLEQSKDDWQWFLQQTEPVSGEQRAELLNGAPSVAAYMAWQMEFLYFPQHQRVMYALNRVIEADELWAFGLKRAQAVLDEGASAYFPDVESVKESRRAQIRKELKSLSADEILPYQEKLSMDEKLAWGDILTGFGENLPSGIVELRKRVIKVNWPDVKEQDQEMKKSLESLCAGKEVNEAMLDGILKLTLDHAATHYLHAVFIQSAGENGFGFKVQVGKGDWSQQMKDIAFDDLGEDLQAGKLKKVAVMFTYGDGETSMAHLRETDVKEDEAARKKMKDEFLKKSAQGEAAYLVYISETSESYVKRMSEEEEDDF
ncbi:hypothetical protein HW115_08100 [Verrucomicrobiaceae bacterium N1E253]|uniref:Uncharacterized protein n=1 Tax=Oceaniferula marina TaxID=2748318 RepID=A0A851GLE2_9BACT|nr:hypothetical protein [Oceaniferula marina]NWK55570.1 hypothetical protein [Oceaniferula marina]